MFSFFGYIYLILPVFLCYLVLSRWKKRIPNLSFIKSETTRLPETPSMSRDGDIILSSISVMHLVIHADPGPYEINNYDFKLRMYYL